MTAWPVGRLIGYDLESTGTDPLTARIVTAALVYTNPGARPSTIEWFIDPGIEIPEEAAQVHGWTRDRLVEFVGGEGRALRVTTGSQIPMAVDGALGELAGHLAQATHLGVPVVVANAAYDLTLTETELPRYDIDPISVRPTGLIGIVDPMVIEKAFDPYRKVRGGCKGGKYQCGGCGMEDKQLTSLCAHYGIRLTSAHNAAADALAAVRVSVKLSSLWPELARWTLPTLHKHEVQWRREQADSLRTYFDRNDIEHDGVDPGWPVHTSLLREVA